MRLTLASTGTASYRYDHRNRVVGMEVIGGCSHYEWWTHYDANSNQTQRTTLYWGLAAATFGYELNRMTMVSRAMPGRCPHRYQYDNLSRAD